MTGWEGRGDGRGRRGGEWVMEGEGRNDGSPVSTWRGLGCQGKKGWEGVMDGEDGDGRGDGMGGS